MQRHPNVYYMNLNNMAEVIDSALQSPSLLLQDLSHQFSHLWISRRGQGGQPSQSAATFVPSLSQATSRRTLFALQVCKYIYILLTYRWLYMFIQFHSFSFIFHVLWEISSLQVLCRIRVERPPKTQVVWGSLLWPFHEAILVGYHHIASPISGRRNCGSSAITKPQVQTTTSMTGEGSNTKSTS